MIYHSPIANFRYPFCYQKRFWCKKRFPISLLLSKALLIVKALSDITFGCKSARLEPLGMVWVVQLNEYALCLVSTPMVAERLFSWSPPPRGPPIHSMVGPPQGLPRRSPERILGTKHSQGAAGSRRQWRRLTALKWSTRSDNGHCQVLQLCRCSTLAAESSGWNLMIKLSWTAIRCCRRVSFVMRFHRSVCGVAGRSRRKAYSWYHAARPSRCGWLAQLHVIAKEPMAYLYNPGVLSPEGNLRTGLQQRAAQAAGQASVDGGQVTMGGASWPNVRQSPHGEA